MILTGNGTPFKATITEILIGDGGIGTYKVSGIENADLPEIKLFNIVNGSWTEKKVTVNTGHVNAAEVKEGQVISGIAIPDDTTISAIKITDKGVVEYTLSKSVIMLQEADDLFQKIITISTDVPRATLDKAANYLPREVYKIFENMRVCDIVEQMKGTLGNAAWTYAQPRADQDPLDSFDMNGFVKVACKHILKTLYESESDPIELLIPSSEIAR